MEQDGSEGADKQWNGIGRNMFENIHRDRPLSLCFQLHDISVRNVLTTVMKRQGEKSRPRGDMAEGEGRLLTRSLTPWRTGNKEFTEGSSLEYVF